MGYRSKTFKSNDAGIRALLKSDEALNVVNSYAEGIAVDDHKRSFKGYDRAQCYVKTTKEIAEKYR